MDQKSERLWTNNAHRTTSYTQAINNNSSRGFYLFERHIYLKEALYTFFLANIQHV